MAEHFSDNEARSSVREKLNDNALELTDLSGLVVSVSNLISELIAKVNALEARINTKSYSTPTLNGVGGILATDEHVFTWTDSSPKTGRKYQLEVNGVLRPVVTSPTKENYVTNLPTDGSTISIVLYWWDDDDISNTLSVSGNYTAFTETATSDSQFYIPASNIVEGSYGRSAWEDGIGDLGYIFWESGGDSITSVSTVDGRRALGVRLDSSVSPSTRLGAGAVLPSTKTASLEQWVYFDKDFDWGGSNEGGKLGFGLAGGSRPAGGLTKQDGFTSRFMWRDNGSIYAYIYDASTSGYGDDYSLGFTAPRGSWFKLKMEVEMNSEAGVADGVLRAWVNGNLMLERDNMEWFGQGIPQIDSLLHFTFHGGDDGTWSPSRTNHVYFADIGWSLDESKEVNPPAVWVSPANGSTATSPNVRFEWSGESGYVYDLLIYSDEAETQKVVGTDGNVFDTNGIGTQTSYTFSNDPSDGGERYAVLYYWPDNSYNASERRTIKFQYTAYTNASAATNYVYGPGLGGFSLSNRHVDPGNTEVSDRDQFAISFKAPGTYINGVRLYHVYQDQDGYGHGDCGLVKYEIQTDNGGNPSGTVIGETKNIIAAPGKFNSSESAARAVYGSDPVWTHHGESGTALRSFRLIDTISNVTTTPGQIYHIVVKNTTPDPTTAMVSINSIRNSKQNYRNDTVGFDKSKEWRVKHLNGSTWFDNTASTNYGLIPVFEVTGSHTFGQSFYGVPSGNVVYHLSSSSSIREIFTPPENMTLTAVAVAAAAQSGGSITVKVKQGGSTLFTGTISGFPTAQDINNPTKNNDDVAFREVSMPSVSITSGSQVELELTSSSTFAIGFGADGSGGYFIGNSLTGNGFNEGTMQRNTGSGWSTLPGNACLSFAFKRSA